jgi:hypothetical protein
LSQLTFVNDLFLNGIDFSGHFPPLEPGIRSFRSLTRLRISHCHVDSFNDLADVLRSCHKLEDLKLVNNTCVSESIPVACSFPSLRHITIDTDPVTEDVTTFLLFFQPVPALHSFTFHYVAGPGNTEYVLPVNTFLQSIGPSLRHLDIDDLWGLESCSRTPLVI